MQVERWRIGYRPGTFKVRTTRLVLILVSLTTYERTNKEWSRVISLDRELKVFQNHMIWHETRLISFLMRFTILLFCKIKYLNFFTIVPEIESDHLVPHPIVWSFWPVIKRTLDLILSYPDPSSPHPPPPTGNLSECSEPNYPRDPRTLIDNTLRMGFVNISVSLLPVWTLQRLSTYDVYRVKEVEVNLDYENLSDTPQALK